MHSVCFGSNLWEYVVSSSSKQKMCAISLASADRRRNCDVQIFKQHPYSTRLSNASFFLNICWFKLWKFFCRSLRCIRINPKNFKEKLLVKRVEMTREANRGSFVITAKIGGKNVQIWNMGSWQCWALFRGDKVKIWVQAYQNSRPKAQALHKG